MTEHPLDKWRDWHGNRAAVRPVGRARVRVRRRDGTEFIAEADQLHWDHRDRDNDIVAYRVGGRLERADEV